MNRFTVAELADIHFVCNIVNVNGRAAILLYRERFRKTLVPNRQMFAHVASEHGSFTVSMQDTSCLDVNGLDVKILSYASQISSFFFWGDLEGHGVLNPRRFSHGPGARNRHRCCYDPRKSWYLCECSAVHAE
ncbi:hypothetical protein AVEN_269937-1 [Araneus ventricosus]|uniref:DUF4817 domain-containing protein n=1 Tax=Araneus ventricosus TaxID=182803 RepID=A0A4Y2QQA5_ARAVE|nr:hypothetical protein AVEN_269937-1 [Araneus ventricosus]